jgi:uncharacterized repeat protein (TIGR03803 family)
MTNKAEAWHMKPTRWFGPRRAAVASAFAAILWLGTPARAQTYTVLYDFGSFYHPNAAMIFDATSGTLYGTTESDGEAGSDAGLVFALYANGEEKNLRYFGGWNGAHPIAPLVEDALGNVYGTTYEGGSLGLHGNGSVFKLGEDSVLYAFSGSPDGANPYAGLIVDSQENLYGTTLNGGAYGYGTVFKVDAAGAETVLYSFAGGEDGASPYGGVIIDSLGNLYGTTWAGGTHGYGTVFKLDASGVETTLYSFKNGRDGGHPTASLIMDSAGNFYGTTNTGGDPSCTFGNVSGCGTVFKLEANGSETVLHSFAGLPDGAGPFAGVIRDAAGNLYGTTVYGGTKSVNANGDGTVFEISSAGVETILHRFEGGGPKGSSEPYGGLVMDSAGNLYGTASGAAGEYGNGDGVAFEITP